MTQVAIAPGFTAHYPPRLQVIAAAINDGETTPTGIHLRWFSPKSLPRVAKVDPYRFDQAAWKILIRSVLRKSSVDMRSNRQTNWADTNHHRILHEISALLVTPVSDKKQCLIRFSEPATAVRLNFSRPGVSYRASIFHRSARLYNRSVKSGSLIEGPGITDILLQVSAWEVLSVEVAYESAIMAKLSESGTLQPIASISVPASVDEAYKLAEPDVIKKLRNRFVEADDIDLFKETYAPEQVEQLVEALSDDLSAINATRDIESQFGASATQVSIGSSLNLALLDPNVARLAGSYYTDQKADVDKDWRYFLLGSLRQGVPKYVVGYARSRKPLALPKLEEPRAKQLPGISYINRKPVGRVGIFTHKKDRSSASSPITLVDVDRIRDSGPERLTQHRPARFAGAGAILYTDTKRPINSRSTYAVRPIDLFGRVGKPAKTPSVTVQDLAAPTPPTQLAIRVDQQGFPWTDPAALQTNTKTGSITATFCYGEGAHTLSPDAVKAHVRWYAGSAQHPPANFDAWNHFATVELKPPIETRIALTPEQPLAEVTLPVVAIRQVKENRAPAPRVSNSAEYQDIASVPERCELLLDRALLEPDLFAGYRGVLDGRVFMVQSSTAGTSYGDDRSEDKSLCARLIVKADMSSAGQGAARLFLPLVRDMTRLQLNSALRLGTPAAFDEYALLLDLTLEGQSLPSPTGGELAIDLRYKIADSGGEPIWSPVSSASPTGHQETLVARMVSEPVKSPDRPQHWHVLARLRPLDYVKLHISALNATESHATRVYPLYVVEPHQLGIGIDADIRLDLPTDARFETLFFCAAAVDSNATTGTASSPVEARIIAPPPEAPSPPHPREGGASAPVGYADVPDQRRHSRVAIGWQRDGDESIRYELSRAMDTSIIALHKSLWSAGRWPPQADLPTESFETSVTGSSVLPNGLLRIDLDLSQSQTLQQLQTAQGGRVSVYHTSQNASVWHHHQIVAVKQHHDLVYCLCKPVSDSRTLGSVDTSQPVTLTTAPDYTALLAEANGSQLRALANTRDEEGRVVLDGAFAVTTGAPLRAADANAFHDIVPGPARNRYYYRIRSLAPSGAASAWSEASVAFRSFPPAPERLSNPSIKRIGSQWLISWDRPHDTIDRLEVAIVNTDNRLENSRHVSKTDFRAAPRFMPGRILLFKPPIEVPVPDAPTDNMEALLADWQVTLNHATTALEGHFITRLDLTVDENRVLRLSGFKADSPLSFDATQAVVSKGNTTEQNLDLTNPERVAVVVDAMDTQSDALSNNFRIELRAAVEHDEIWLPSIKVEVFLDA